MVAVDEEQIDPPAVEQLLQRDERLGVVRVAAEEVELLPRLPEFAESLRVFLGIAAAERASRQVDADEKRIGRRRAAPRVERAPSRGPDFDDAAQLSFLQKPEEPGQLLRLLARLVLNRLAGELPRAGVDGRRAGRARAAVWSQRSPQLAISSTCPGGSRRVPLRPRPSLR